jgi:osmotically-inducible protein OsmY
MHRLRLRPWNVPCEHASEESAVMQTGFESHRDVSIQDAVVAALRADDRVRSPDVGVEVHGGVVTLTGTVPTWSARNAAQDAAHRVPGVRDIANELVVGPHVPHPLPIDVEVVRHVRAALEGAGASVSRAIVASVSGGVVTLEGTCASTEERDAMVSAAGAAEGVRRVQSWIVVRAPAGPAEELMAQATRALARHAAHAAKHIDVSLVGDVVKLSGVVRSEAERSAVVGAIKGAAGKRLIDSRELHVVP